MLQRYLELEEAEGAQSEDSEEEAGGARGWGDLLSVDRAHYLPCALHALQLVHRLPPPLFLQDAHDLLPLLVQLIGCREGGVRGWVRQVMQKFIVPRFASPSSP